VTWYACTTQVLRMCYEAETPHALSSKLLYHPNSSNPHVLSSKLLYASVSCSVSVTEVCVCRSVCVLHFARQSEWARRDAAGITPPSTCRRHYTIVSGGSSREAGGGCGCALGGLDCCLIFSVRLPGLKQDRQCKRLEQTASRLALAFARYYNHLSVTSHRDNKRGGCQWADKTVSALSCGGSSGDYNTAPVAATAIMRTVSKEGDATNNHCIILWAC